MASFKPRRAQREILAYSGGKLAISAVPGAGKTTSLVMLASKLVVEDGIRPSQLLILTYTRSAAANIRDRIRKALAAVGKPGHGLKAQTIHGFCHELLTRHAGRLGFPQGFEVLQAREQEAILQTALTRHLEDPDSREAWLRSHGLDPLEGPGADAITEAQGLSRKAALKALTAIKNLDADLDAVAAALQAIGYPELPPMLRFYEAERLRRGKLDYDDMIRLVNRLLADDPSVLATLQGRFRYVLEDEAQDSTPGQKRIIDQLVASHGNLIRVGDSNQSIYATFTMNTPEFFREFCREAPRVTMDESSRSCDAVIEMANRLVKLVGAIHPEDAVRDAAFEANLIRPAEDGHNPATPPEAIRWLRFDKRDDEEREIARLVAKARETKLDGRYLTQAILVAKNFQAESYLKKLGELAGPLVAVGSQGNAAVMVSEVVMRMLRFLCLETSANQYREHLVEAHLAMVRHHENLYAEAKPLKERRARLLAFIHTRGLDWRLLLSPQPGQAVERPEGFPSAEWAAWVDFLRRAGTLLARRHLSPVDVVTAVAETFFQGTDDSAPYKLSIGQAMALVVRRLLFLNPEYRLADVIAALDLQTDDQYRQALFPATLEEIARGHGPESPSDEPHPVRILTLHSAKGLEFDCVWMPGLNNNQDFPWLPEQARVTESRVLVTEQVVSAVAEGRQPELEAVEAAAAVAQVAERLRLLYVGLTRAQRFLRLSYTTPSDWVLERNPHLRRSEHLELLEKMPP